MRAEFDIYSGSSRIQRVMPSPIRAILDRAGVLRAQGHPVIPFSAGEPNFNTPEPIKQATIRAIEDNFSHYASNRGVPELRQGLSRKIFRETGVDYDAESEILITSSGAEAINNAILAFAEDGDEVILFTPAFVSYANLVNYTGAKLVELPLKAENGFQPDPAKLESKITDRTKLLILNNPNNPTGAVYTPAVLEKLAALAVKHNLLVLSDEMYSRLVYGGAQFTSMAAFPGMKERTLLVNGFSKTYAMTGWRLGYIAADRRLVAPLLKIHQYSTTTSPTFIQQGLINSMDLPETETAVGKMIQAFAQRRLAMLKGLDSIPALSYVKPYGAFYVMVNVAKTGMDGSAFAKKLLEEKFVATVPALGFGGECGDFIRISYAASDEDIAEGLRRIREFVQAL